MSSGTVKWFDPKKGFGFILNDDGKDVFVHFSSIEGDGFRSLKDGDVVEYEQIEGDKGLSAKSVRRTGSSLSENGQGQMEQPAGKGGLRPTVRAPLPSAPKPVRKTRPF